MSGSSGSRCYGKRGNRRLQPGFLKHDDLDKNDLVAIIARDAQIDLTQIKRVIRSREKRRDNSLEETQLIGENWVPNSTQHALTFAPQDAAYPKFRPSFHEDCVHRAQACVRHRKGKLMTSAHARLNEARLEAIIRSAMEAIIVVDETQHVVIFNPMAERVFGYSAAEAIGAPLERFMPERYRAGHSGHVEQFGTTGVSDRRMGGQRRLFGLRANGDEFPVEASISQIPDGEGRLYTVMLRDISERVQAEQALYASREELRLLSGSIQAAREQEKARLARELHDDLGQQLTALKLDITILEDELLARTDHALLLSHVQGMFSLLDTTVLAVRRIAADLRPPILDDLGLEPSIEWLVEDFSQRYAIPVTASLETGNFDFAPDAATAVFRIVQEGLTNIARHANATSVELSLRQDERGFVLRLVDNGRGCSTRDASARNSFGLLGVRERVHLLGGTLQIVSAPDAGFQLTVVLPALALKAANAGGAQ